MELVELIRNIEKIAYTENYKIAQLQYLRKKLKNLSRIPSKKIFDERYITEDWAFHYGGRTEIQFNIGYEDGNQCRYGIAFSLEPSRSLPDVSILYPKIDLFNDWLYMHQDELTHLEMWYWKEGIRSSNFPPTSIPDYLKCSKSFIFMGKLQPIEIISKDVSPILELFDTMLPLYQYVEAASADKRYPVFHTGIKFHDGCPKKLTSTIGNYAGGEKNIQLRHNVLQYKLYTALDKSQKYKHLGVEAQTPTGLIDVCGEYENGAKDYYEIKTAVSAQACIREALSQLLEYSYWPGSEVAQNLIIAGVAEIDKATQMYLDKLCEILHFKLSYYQIKE